MTDKPNTKLVDNSSKLVVEEQPDKFEQYLDRMILEEETTNNDDDMLLHTLENCQSIYRELKPQLEKQIREKTLKKLSELFDNINENRPYHEPISLTTLIEAYKKNTEKKEEGK